jgi:hypothetical protein
MSSDSDSDSRCSRTDEINCYLCNAPAAVSECVTFWDATGINEVHLCPQCTENSGTECAACSTPLEACDNIFIMNKLSSKPAYLCCSCAQASPETVASAAVKCLIGRTTAAQQAQVHALVVELVQQSDHATATTTCKK